MENTKNHYKVKRILFLLVLILLAGKSYNVQAQDTNITLSIEVTDASSRQSEDGTIQIEVQGSGSNFTYMLYDKEPWKNGKKLKPDTRSGESYTFTDLESGNYFVCVQNKDEVSKCTNVSINLK